MATQYEKLVLAILQGDDYPDTVKALNEHGYSVTLLNSSGGFLKKRSVTVMIGVEDARLQELKELLRTHSGSREETAFLQGGVGMPSMPVKLSTGGSVVFVLNVDSFEKY